MTIELDTPPASLTIELPAALKVGAAEYKQLVLREPLCGEVLLAEQQLKRGLTAESMRLYHLTLIAKIAEVPLPVINLIPVTVFNRAVSYLASFNLSGPNKAAE